MIAVAAGALLVAAPGAANAGSITPIQYAYGGGSNAAAVIATRPPGSQPPAGGASATGTGAGTGTSAGTGAGAGGGASTGAAGSPGHAAGRSAAAPLVGIAAVPAGPVGSFAALHRAVPNDALWAIGLAVACALGAWLVRRGNA